MLALVCSLFLALYILGPELFFRFIVRQFAPARHRVSNRGEEITRAVFISAVPVLSIGLLEHWVFHRFSDFTVLRNFLYGLYSDQSLKDHFDLFFPAARTIIWLNVKFLLIPVYGLFLLLALVLGIVIRHYGKIARWLESAQPKRRALQTARNLSLKGLLWLIRPWVAEWHLKLSRDLLPTKQHYIRVDILTKMDVLFRGTLVEHQLGPDGCLISITLKDPQKYKREELLEARRAAKGGERVDPSRFWSSIEAKEFMIMAGEIVTLNLNYVELKSLAQLPSKNVRESAAKILRLLAERLDEPES